MLFVAGDSGSKDTSAKVNIKSQAAVFLAVAGHVVPLLIFHSCVSACQTAVHKKCHDKLLTKCPESGRESENTVVSKYVLFDNCFCSKKGRNFAEQKAQIFFNIRDNDLCLFRTICF